MNIATTALACVLGLGLTACVQEEVSVADGPESPSKKASTPDVAAATMTTTALELDKEP